ncbi:dUTP diphosphatase [Aquibacillus sediminis]|uniref:dUTP diphosphatase n=1 Tax=Aquibacillus sediminis TaxID=2574734 RepID=UPI0011083C63|nr:dUTP diphosphatase [Aquibacillus sediminis]
MNWDQLFTMQEKLDTYIETNHNLQASDLVNKKILALLVEVGELANETRCFKFWSHKDASERQVILEEYVDGLHFILSLGLESNFRYDAGPIPSSTEDVTTLFNHVFEQIIAFKQTISKETYHQMFTAYLALGNSLGFDETSVKQAYYEKNKVNHERQDKGY